jgi:methylase of polypeptide subunit release factors
LGTSRHRFIWSHYFPLGLVGPLSYLGSSDDTDRAVAAEISGVPACWPLPNSRTKPGHGMLLLPHLNVQPGDRFLDLGCGPLALHGSFAALAGAGRTICVDTDRQSVELARSVAGDLSLEVIRSDLTTGVSRLRFDRISFHPPMLPKDRRAETVLRAEAASYHFAGLDGRHILDRGIQEAASVLAPRGKLVIGQFEFLGVETSFGVGSSTMSTCERYGLTLESVKHYVVKMTAPVYATLPRLRHLFPRYEFAGKRELSTHRFSVIVARH